MKRLLITAALLVACKDKAPPPSTTTAPPAPPVAPAADAKEAFVQHEVKTDMPPPAEITSLVKANNHFALELWTHAGPGNNAISPLSISTALAMAWAGAKGDTAEQMRKTMHLEGKTDSLVSQWARISYAMQDASRPLVLKMANRLYGDAHYEFDTIYFTITRKAFSAPLEIVDFHTDPEAARAKINTFVADQTEQRIKDLLPPRSVDAETRLVIINAIYFLADWATPFDKAATHDAEFHVSAASKKTVPMMHLQDNFKLARGAGASMIELPYKERTASMYILLPDKVDGLAALEKKLPDTLKALQPKLADQTVLVSLPRFVIDPGEPLRLAKPLQALGMVDAFDRDKADFTGIAKPVDPKDRLFIGEVLHKAFVKVDEKGTEAAAATAVIMPRGAGPPPAATAFNADHPFLFLIVDRGSGLILFVGRVVEPVPPT
ncbi:MAG TPA: serpin family protein [Kofleriaceae bacterium]